MSRSVLIKFSTWVLDFRLISNLMATPPRLERGTCCLEGRGSHFFEHFEFTSNFKVLSILRTFTVGTVTPAVSEFVRLFAGHLGHILYIGGCFAYRDFDTEVG